MNEEFYNKFIYKPPQNLENEFGASHPVRFITDAYTINLKEKAVQCLDCDAQSLWNKLQKIDFHHPDTDIPFALDEMKNALMFILENTEWYDGC